MSSMQPAPMNTPDLALVAEVALGLRHRLYQLTSTWTDAPVDVHRLQETVARACTILHSSSLHAASSEAPVSSRSGVVARNRPPVHEQLSGYLAITRRIIEELVGIIEFIQPNPHQDSTGITKRWRLRREEVALLRLRLGDGIHHVLTHVSLLNISVSTSSQMETSMMDEYGYSEDISAIRAYPSGSGPGPLYSEGTNSTFIRDSSDIAVREETAVDRESDLKFRNVDFTESVRRIDVAHRDTAHGEADEQRLAIYQKEKMMRLPIEEQKSLSYTHLEPKSPDNLRGARIHHANALDEHQTPRQAHNEKEFQHLERVFQMISPFDSQEADWAVAPSPRLEMVRSSSPQSRYLSKRDSRLEGHYPRSGHLVSALRTHRLQEGCPPSCICVCHSQAYTGRGALSAFKTAFGSFTFIFNSRSPSVTCNVSTCLSRRGQYLQIIYRFPYWLFHAAISATVKDWTMGSPELLLRVHRRIDANMMSTYTSIFGYITRGDIDNVKRVLTRREASVYDVAGVTGVSMLYHALRLRQMEVVELLLCEGADVFQLDDAGLGPYHEAVQVLYTSASAPFQDRLQEVLPMDQIMEAAQLTTLHKIAMGILWAPVADHVTSSNGAGDTNAGDSNNLTPLYYAAAKGNSAVVQALLAAGAYPDGAPQAASSSSSSAAQHPTPLSMAARNGHLAVVERLLAAGAQVNARGKHNRTALHECSPLLGDRSLQHTFVAIAACLLAHGADLAVVDNYGSTVLDTTCIRDHARVAAFFVARGIDTTHRDWEGSNALGNCVCFNSLECAALLLGLGSARSGILNVDDNGTSVLHYMATGGSAEMMELFAESGLRGPDPELRDSQGRTALELLNSRLDVTDELRDAFMRLLHAMSSPEEAGIGSHGSDSESDSAEFFDAGESWA